jgi:uncharacterized membrane protein YgdD (TMEM256/DUF423 family)
MGGMAKFLLACGALAGFIGVGLGAFGAHALKARLSPELMGTYQTAVQYQFWHALGLGLIGLLLFHVPTSSVLKWAGVLMALGIVLFSGSLYALIFSGFRGFGMVTPIGGICWLVAWGLLFWAVVRV